MLNSIWQFHHATLDVGARAARRCGVAVGLASVAGDIIAEAAPSALLTSLEQTGPVVSEVNTQVDQLRGRLQQVKPYPEPSRDPFNFGTRAVPKPASPPPAPAAIEKPAAPVLPELVAIVGDAKSARRAVLSAGDDVRFVKVGEATGVFVVQSLSADAMVVDQTTGKSYTVTLR